MRNLTVILALVVLILIGTNAIFVAKYINVNIVLAKKDLDDSARLAESRRTIAFLKLLTEKILQAEGEVDFEDRL